MRGTSVFVANDCMPFLPAVVMDERGYLRIVGRIKDIIIRGGENISPREVEEFLYTHPAIQVCTAHLVRCTAVYCRTPQYSHVPRTWSIVQLPPPITLGGEGGSRTSYNNAVPFFFAETAIVHLFVAD
jgi:hypothetical protein